MHDDTHLFNANHSSFEELISDRVEQLKQNLLKNCERIAAHREMHLKMQLQKAQRENTVLQGKIAMDAKDSKKTSSCMSSHGIAACNAVHCLTSAGTNSDEIIVASQDISGVGILQVEQPPVMQPPAATLPTAFFYEPAAVIDLGDCNGVGTHDHEETIVAQSAATEVSHTKFDCETPSQDLRADSDFFPQDQSPFSADVAKEGRQISRSTQKSKAAQSQVARSMSKRSENTIQDTFDMLDEVYITPQTLFQNVEKQKMRFLYLFVGPETVVQFFFDLTIISNVIVLGFQAGSQWSGWVFVDSFYAAMFMCEIIHKVWVKGIVAFSYRTPDARWHWFDLALAILSVVDVLISYIDFSSPQSSNMNWLRMIRLVRIARILRLLQLDMFRDLLLMINGATGGVRTLLWSIVLITVPIYVFALFFTEMVGLQDDLEVESDVTDVKPLFESVSASMFTGFRCLVVGDCATKQGTPIFLSVVATYGWSYGVIYSLTSVCMSFGLFNVIVAIYVENTVAAAKSNEMIQRQRRLDDRTRFAVRVINLVHFLWKHDEHLDGDFKLREAMEIELTEEYYQSLLDDPEFLAVLEDLDIPREDHRDLFEICDADGSGRVSMVELVSGVRKLRGDPRRSDLVYVMLRIQQLMSELQELKRLQDPAWTEEDNQRQSRSSKRQQDVENVFKEAATMASSVRKTLTSSRTNALPSG